MNVSPPPPPPTLRVSLAPEPHLADSAVASPVTLLRHHADGTSRLNHFLVTAVLGAGSYGTVYRATDEATGTEVAIKELSKALLRRAHWAARLARGGGSGAAHSPGPTAGSSWSRRPSSSRGRGRGLGMATATATPRTLPMEIVDPTLDAALANEMAILMQLHHPNVVRLHEAIDDAEHDAVFLVIDLCPNGPIFRLPSSNSGEGAAGPTSGSGLDTAPHTLLSPYHSPRRRRSVASDVFSTTSKASSSSSSSAPSIPIASRRASYLSGSDVEVEKEQDDEDVALPSPHRGSFAPIAVGPHAPPLALGTARRYFTDAVLGLEYLHHNRIAHQDIKPDNLLLTQDNRVKIADFGLSQLYNVRGDRRSSGNSSNGNHRLSGPTGGAPAFCPPEKCTMAVYVPTVGSVGRLRAAGGGMPPSPRPAAAAGVRPSWDESAHMRPSSVHSAPTTLDRAELSPFAAACTADIWSLGVVLFLMTHGRLPFHATSLLMLYRAIACDPPAIADDDPDLAHLLARMLDKNPATRISLSDIRQHPWLTQRGQIQLPSFAENTTPLLHTPHGVSISGSVSAIRFVGILRRRAAVSAAEARAHENDDNNSSDDDEKISDHDHRRDEKDAPRAAAEKLRRLISEDLPPHPRDQQNVTTVHSLGRQDLPPLPESIRARSSSTIQSHRHMTLDKPLPPLPASAWNRFIFACTSPWKKLARRAKSTTKI